MAMNALKDKIYGYLEFKGIYRSEANDALIEQSIKELAELNSYRCVYKKYSEPIDFLLKEPYVSFLSGSNGYYLCALTLGDAVDLKTEYYLKADKEKGVIFDACANAYLELKNDEIRLSLGDGLSYLFCPGYQGSDVCELSIILNMLKADELGIERIDSGMMKPNKTMAGIYAIGVTPRKKCGSCIKLNECAYRKAGKLCFDLEKK